MRITALCNVEVPGWGIVRRGETIDYPKDRIDERIAANFLDAKDERRLKVSQRAAEADQPQLLPKTKEEMLLEQDAARKAARKDILAKMGGIEGVREKLAEFGVSFNRDTSEDVLCDRLVELIGD